MSNKHNAIVELLLDCLDIGVIISIIIIIIITIIISIIIGVFTIIILLLDLGGEQPAQCHRGAVTGLPGPRSQLPGQDREHTLARCG